MDLIHWNIFGRLYKTVVSSLHPGSFNQEDDETVDDEHFHPMFDVTALCDYRRCDWPAAEMERCDWRTDRKCWNVAEMARSRQILISSSFSSTTNQS